jgi:hypothetical protein
MDHGWGYLTGVLTHPVLKEASVDAKAPGPRRLKPGALGRTGTRMPMGMKRFLDSCEASHRNVLARLRAEVAADEVAAEKVAAEKARAFHLEEREMMERATRRTNAKDPWHFVKDLQTVSVFLLSYCLPILNFAFSFSCTARVTPLNPTRT